jgi:hypothetical protein
MRYAADEMLTHTTAPLLLLAGCHVFSSGEIPLTCDELADCGSDTDSGSDTTAPEDLSLSVGIALSMLDAERWLAAAYDPPDLDPRVQKGGPGSTAGAVAWSVDRNRLVLAAEGALFVFGPNETDIKKFPLPTLEPVRDMEVVGQAVYLITDSWIIGQPSPSADPALINDSGEGLGFISMLADGPTLYVVTQGSGAGPDLYTFQTESDTADLIAAGFDTDSTRVGGDIFLGTDGALMSCSETGEIYDLDALLDGGDGAPIAGPTALSISDALTCGIDPDSGRYLVISATGGLLLFSADGEDLQVPLTAEGGTLGGAQIY